MPSPALELTGRSMNYRRASALLALLLVMPGLQALAQEKPTLLGDFLKRHIHLTHSQFDALDRGAVVTKILPTQDKREIAVFGIVLVHVSAEEYAVRFMDIETFKKSKLVRQIHKFQMPPQLSDLDELQLPREDLDSLRQCRVGRCGVKLPAEMIERFQEKVEWAAPGSKEKANELFRQALFGYVQTYLKGGNTALAEYNDKKHPIRLAEEFSGLLSYSPYLYEYVPELHAYLENYPKEKLEGATDFLYWSLESFGLKPTISVTHVTVYRKEAADRTGILIASKQIVASHYFDASLGLTALVEVADASGKPGVYVVYVNRSRADALKGSFSGMRREIVEERTADGMKKNLTLLRDRLEFESKDTVGDRP